MKIKKAFTLAEVLVTLGIIGVVSAMTIPSLTQNWQKRAYVTQLHKAYSEIQQAFVNQMNETNATNLMEAGLRVSGVSSFLKNRFKVVKDCGNSISPCFADSYKTINGGSSDMHTSRFSYSIVTGSGVAIQIDVSDELSDYEDTIWLGYIYVDINGPKGPNIAGRDFFKMYIYPDGSLDSAGVPINCRKYSLNCDYGNSPRNTREQYYSTFCKGGGLDFNGGCFGKILNDGWEMKY